VIARSNITLLKVAAELDNVKQPYIFVGGVKGYDFELIRDLALFCNKVPPVRKHPFLRMFSSKSVLMK
jgi:hypothetical protein